MATCRGTHEPAKYDSTQKPTMIFNSECKLVNNPYSEEKSAIVESTNRRRANA